MRNRKNALRFKLNEFPYNRMNLTELRKLRFTPRIRPRQVICDKNYGSGGGIISPDWDANIILDLQREKLQTGQAFLYLVRRFGFPLNGCDEQKAAAFYILTTPQRDVFLTVSILSNMVRFGSIVSAEIENELVNLTFAGFDEWDAGLKDWARRKRNVEIISHFDYYDSRSDYVSGIFRTYLLSKYSEEFLDTLATPEREKLLAEEKYKFLDIKEKEADELSAQYSKIRKHPRRRFAHSNFAPDTLGITRLALCRTIKELLRPVNIRDTRLNIKKYLMDGESRLSSAEYDEFSGYGISALISLPPNERRRLLNLAGDERTKSRIAETAA